MRAVAVTSAVVAFALCASAIQGKSFGSAPTNSQAASGWRDTFDVHKSNLLPTGTNPYITMQPGRVLKLKHGKDTLTVTILRETQQIDGVTAGILEERETKNGKQGDSLAGAEKLGTKPELRQSDGRTFVTDGGNFILDCPFSSIAQPRQLEQAINMTVGVVENGLFLGRSAAVIVASARGVDIMTPGAGVKA